MIEAIGGFVWLVLQLIDIVFQVISFIWDLCSFISWIFKRIGALFLWATGAKK